MYSLRSHMQMLYEFDFFIGCKVGFSARAVSVVLGENGLALCILGVLLFKGTSPPWTNSIFGTSNYVHVITPPPNNVPKHFSYTIIPLPLQICIGK
jgi:hypothetical protein